MSEKNLARQLCSKMLSANRTAMFCDHQYLWKDSIDILDFLPIDNC